MAETNYGFDETTAEASSGSKFIQVTPETAVATGRFIKELKFEENDGNPFLEIIVCNAQGQTANRRYFQPKIDGTYVKNEEELKKAVTKFNSIMANLARRFLGEGYKPQNVTDFTTLCKTIIKDVGNKYVNKELRIKVILKNNFPTLPAYAPIFEDVATSPTKLMVNSIDTVVSTYKGKSDVTPDADAPAGNGPIANDSGLPF